MSMPLYTGYERTKQHRTQMIISSQSLGEVLRRIYASGLNVHMVIYLKDGNFHLEHVDGKTLRKV